MLNRLCYMFTMLYKALVRPILEYAAPLWSPYLVKDVQVLESIQRRASRIVSSSPWLNAIRQCLVLMELFSTMY